MKRDVLKLYREFIKLIYHSKQGPLESVSDKATFVYITRQAFRYGIQDPNKQGSICTMEESLKRGQGVLRLVRLFDTIPLLEESELQHLEGEELKMALLKRCWYNLAWFLVNRYNKKSVFSYVRRKQLQREHIPSPYLLLDEMVHTLNDELGTCFLTRIPMSHVSDKEQER